MKVKTSLEGEPPASEEDFSCSPGGKKVEMDKTHFEGETTLANSPSEENAKSCRSKNSKANIIIKPCKVLLKNIDCELKNPHKYCLIPPKTKKLQKINAKKIVSFRILQGGLCNLLDRQCIKTSGNPLHPAALPENKKVNKMESGLVLNSSVKILSKKTNTDHGSKKTEREANFPDSSMLCANTFTKFSAIKSNPENSTAGFCHDQENKKDVESVQEDPVHSETQNTGFFGPTEKSMEPGKMLIGQAERKEEPETSTNSNSQTSRINISISPGDTSQPSRTNSAGSSVPSVLCELEPYLVSSLPGSSAKAALNNEFPRKNIVKRPVEAERNPYSRQSSAEGIVQEQVTEKELDALNQTRPIPRRGENDNGWFELEGNEVVNVGGPICATYEENMSRKMQDGDDSNDVSLSGCQPFPGDVTNLKHNETRKETGLNGREISNAEQRGNSQPTKESLAGVQLQLLSLWITLIGFGENAE